MTDHARSYDHLLSFVIEQPWALTKPMLSVIANVLGRRFGGDTSDPTALAPTLGRQAPPVAGTGVAVIPIHGVIAPRMNLFSEISGGTTFEGLGADLADAVASPSIGTIVLDIDSPGGNVAGATEFAKKVMAARAQKTVIAVAEYSMNSAAYWVGACATEVVAAPSAQLGSIGVYSIHEDLSAALDQLGVKVTYIAAGKYKVDGNSTEPLSADARARMQAKVDHYYALFVTDVARGRGVSVAAVRGGFGEGETVSAIEALSLGMIDRIESLDDTLARFTATPAAPGLRASAPDTSQEPSPATDQDRQRDREQRHAVTRELLALQFTR